MPDDRTHVQVDDQRLDESPPAPPVTDDEIAEVLDDEATCIHGIDSVLQGPHGLFIADDDEVRKLVKESVLRGKSDVAHRVRERIVKYVEGGRE